MMNQLGQLSGMLSIGRSGSQFSPKAKIDYLFLIQKSVLSWFWVVGRWGVMACGFTAWRGGVRILYMMFSGVFLKCDKKRHFRKTKSFLMNHKKLLEYS